MKLCGGSGVDSNPHPMLLGRPVFKTGALPLRLHFRERLERTRAVPSVTDLSHSPLPGVKQRMGDHPYAFDWFGRRPTRDYQVLGTSLPTSPTAPWIGRPRHTPGHAKALNCGAFLMEALEGFAPPYTALQAAAYASRP